MNFKPPDFAPPGLMRRFVNEMVDIVSGTLIWRETDLVTMGIFPQQWIRYYNSSCYEENHGVGLGFSHQFGCQLLFEQKGISFHGVAGLATSFPLLNRDGEYAERDGLYLERMQENRYKLSQRGFPSLEFSRSSDDESPRLTSILSNKGWARLRYDSKGHIKSVETSDEQIVSLGWTGRLLTQVRVGKIEGTESLREVCYEYSERGLLESATVTGSNPVLYEYDAFERLSRVVMGVSTPFFVRYDGEGRCIQLGYEDGSSVYSFEYYPKAYQTIVHDADQNRWIYTAREDGSIIHVLDPCTGSTIYEVDDSGRVTEVKDPVGTVWHIQYDFTGSPVSAEAFGRELSLDIEEIQLPPSFHKVGATSLEWSLGGSVPLPDRRPDVHSLPVDLPGSVRDAITLTEDIGPETMEREFDERGRPISHWFTDGRCRSCDYDQAGRVKSYVDYDGHRTEYEYTAHGKLREVREANGAITRFEHAQNGALTAVVDPLGNRTTYCRDGLGRIVSLHRQHSLQEAYELDAIGQVVEKRGHANKKCVSIKHSRQRLLESVKQNSGDMTVYEWDEKDRLEATESSAGNVVFGYDSAIKRREQDTRDDTGVEHRFGRRGLLETIVADRYSTGYDQPDLNTVVVTDPTGKKHTFKHLGFGLAQWKLANGFIETAQYDPEGRCLLKALHKELAPYHSWICRYTYSDEGDLKSAIVSDQGEYNYAHDEAHRLIAVTYPGGRTDRFTYDMAGNLLEKPGTSLSYGEGNLLASVNGDLVEHNESGSIRLVGRSTMTWFYYDDLDQLVTIKYADGRKIESEYDGLGRRVTKTFGDQEWMFLWDTDRLIGEQLPDESFRLYVYIDDNALVPFLMVKYKSIYDDPTEGQVYTIHADHLGCPHLVLDDQGRTVWQSVIAPFGQATVTQGQHFHMPLRFPGHYYDQESGLHWTRFRAYSPILGRYLQPNPVGIAAGTNLYAACKSPVSSVNVLGLYPCGLHKMWQSTFQPEIRPLQESDSLDYWSGELEQINPLTAGLQALKSTETKCFSAIQNCRQLLNREPELKEEFEQKLLDLETSWVKTVHTTEEFSTFSLPGATFETLVNKLDGLQAEIRKKALIDDDENTLA